LTPDRKQVGLCFPTEYASSDERGSTNDTRQYIRIYEAEAALREAVPVSDCIRQEIDPKPERKKFRSFEREIESMKIPAKLSYWETQ